MPRIRIAEDAQELADRATEEFARRAQDAVLASGTFRVALAGGTTPRNLYRLLAEEGGGSPIAGKIPWGRTQVFFGDERAVPPDHPDSNYRMAYETLLSKVPIPPANVRRVHSEGADPALVASQYENALREGFELPDGEAPRFDLILLGLGADGHTASLFPGSEALRDSDALVAAPWVEKLKTRRYTLTPRVLNAAAHVVFLVSGADKADALKKVLEGDQPPSEVPARVVDPKNGQLLWLVDQDAARLLRRAGQ